MAKHAHPEKEENRRKNDASREAAGIAERRAAMTDALNKAVVTLCEHGRESFEEVLTESLHPLADETRSGRILVYQSVKVDGEERLKQLFLYDKARGGMRSSYINYLPGGPVMQKWWEAVERNEYINLSASDATEDEVAYLAQFGLKAILIVPILTHGESWGAVVFGNLENDRRFDEDCMDLIRSGAMICATAIIRNDLVQNAEKAVDEITDKNLRLNLLISSMKIALWDMDIPEAKDPFAGENVFWWSDEFRQMLGFKDENDFPNLHSSWSDRIHPEDKEMVRGAVSAHMYDLSGKTPLDMEYRIMLKNGKYRYFRAFGETLRDEEGNPLRIAGALEDIHDKRQMQKDIVNARTQEFISKFSVPFTQLYVFDDLMNNALFELREFTRTDRAIILEVQSVDSFLCTYESVINEETPSVLGRSLSYHDLPLFAEADKSGYFYEKDADSYFEKYPTADLGEKSFCYIPLMIEGGRAGYLAFFTMFEQADWAEGEFRLATMAGSIIAGAFSNRRNDALKAEALKAQQASEAKSNFLSVMSHEMRTPLTAIIGMTAIGKDAQDIERKDYALEKIDEASASLLGIINDILDMAKIEANKLEFSPIEYNIEQMLQKVISIAKFYIDEKKQKFNMRVGAKVPKYIIGDDHRLSQVVSNLLANASKFTQEGGEIHLSVSLQSEEDGICTLRFEVTDDGIGISPEQQGKLFQAFSQAESGISRTFGGTGLGLALCKRIVEMMGGQIYVESEMGKGSRFIFTVKAERGKKRHPEADADANAQTREKTAHGQFAGKRMLLAEDLEINREIVKALLDGTELIIDEAENGLEALEKIEADAEKYDVVLMDVQMPKMDGIAATRNIRALPSDYARTIPIVAMSANVFKEDIDKCLEAGMNGHIGKPLNKDEVLAVLGRF